PLAALLFTIQRLKQLSRSHRPSAGVSYRRIGDNSFRVDSFIACHAPKSVASLEIRERGSDGRAGRTPAATGQNAGGDTGGHIAGFARGGRVVRAQPLKTQSG